MHIYFETVTQKKMVLGILKQSIASWIPNFDTCSEAGFVPSSTNSLIDCMTILKLIQLNQRRADS